MMGFGGWDHAALKGPYLVLRSWREGRTVQVDLSVKRWVDRRRRRRTVAAGVVQGSAIVRDRARRESRREARRAGRPVAAAVGALRLARDAPARRSAAPVASRAPTRTRLRTLGVERARYRHGRGALRG